MKTLRLIFGLVVTMVAPPASAATPRPRAPVPVVFATDIGSDVDDTWALAHLLRSPELDLKMVLTETGEARYRGAVTAKLLEVAGRTDVAIALGLDFGAMGDDQRHQGSWIRDYDLARYPGRVHEDGVGAFIELVQQSPQPVTVIAVGPVPSLAAAIEREPRLAEQCRLVGMFGSFDVGYGGEATPAAEWNVRADVPALRTVLAAPWREVLLTPLDTCGLVALRGDSYRAIWCAMDDPLLRAVIENYCLWAPRAPWVKCDFFTTRSSALFDCVAVYLAYDEALVEIESVRFHVTDDGMTVRDVAGQFSARVALRWKDLAAFEHHLGARLLSAGASGDRDARDAAGAAIFAPSNLLAWCIVPFDKLARGPVERVAMLQRLGITQYAWDWREKHLEDLPEEIRLARAAGIKLRAIWLWIDETQDKVGALSAGNRAVLDAVKQAGLSVEFWLGFHENFFAGLDPDARVRKAVAMVTHLRDRAAESGSTVALYNHGGWFGEPENQLRIIGAVGDRSVGMVYNFHHAHDQLDRYAEFLPRIMPHLRAVNLDGMRPEGPKILPIGAGTHERGMIRQLLAAGYRGPIGILGHVDDADVEEILRANLAGLRAITNSL